MGIASARRIAQPPQKRQGQAGGQGQIDLGCKVPPAKVAGVGAAPVARGVNHAGQQRAGQGQITAQCCARQGTHQQEPQGVTRAQLAGAQKRRNGQDHARLPGTRQAKPPYQAQPQGHGQCATKEVNPQRGRLPHLGGLQPVLHKKQHQRGGNGAGDAVEQIHQQQAAKLCVAPRVPDSTRACPRALTSRQRDHDGFGSTAPQPAARQQARQKQGQHDAHTPKCRRQRRQQHAQQAQALTPGDNAAAVERIAPQHGTPGLVRHRQGAVGAIGRHEPDASPQQQHRGRARQRHEEQRKPHSQGQRRQHAHAQHGAQRGGKQTINQAAQQRVNHRVEQAHAQQQRAQCGQRHTILARVQIGHQHVQR